MLLLDEPTASLDPTTAQAVEQAIENWLTAGRDSRALVWVSHDLEQTRRMTTRRIHLRGTPRGGGMRWGNRISSFPISRWPWLRC